MIKTYEALTNAAPSPKAKLQFKFRSGDKVNLEDDDARLLMDAGAVRPLDGRPPAQIDTGSGRTGRGGNSANKPSADE